MLNDKTLTSKTRFSEDSNQQANGTQLAKIRKRAFEVFKSDDSTLKDRLNVRDE